MRDSNPHRISPGRFSKPLRYRYGNLPCLSISLPVFVPFHGLLPPSELVTFHNIADAVLFASFLSGVADADGLSIHDIDKNRDLFGCLHPATSERKVIRPQMPKGKDADMRLRPQEDMRS